MRARKRGGGRQRTGRSEGCFLQENNARQSPQQTPSTKASCSIHWWLRLLAGPTGSRSARFRFQPSRHRVGSLRAFSTLAAETLLVTLHFLPYHRPARPLSPRYLRALPHPVSSDLSYSGPHALCSVGMGSRTMLRRVRRDRRRPLTRENEREREREHTPGTNACKLAKQHAKPERKNCLFRSGMRSSGIRNRHIHRKCTKHKYPPPNDRQPARVLVNIEVARARVQQTLPGNRTHAKVSSRHLKPEQLPTKISFPDRGDRHGPKLPRDSQVTGRFKAC